MPILRRNEHQPVRRIRLAAIGFDVLVQCVPHGIREAEVVGVDATAGSRTSRVIRTRGLTHIALRVRDVERAFRFYTNCPRQLILSSTAAGLSG
jgi:hypothetical protein